MVRPLFWLLTVLAAGAASSPASARVEANSGYSKLQTFSCALRLLRVDRGYEVVEKDPEAAYVLFRYPVSGQKERSNGSVEVVDTSAGVRVFVQLPRLPEYHEALLRDALLKKLREEYGPPAKPTPPAKPPAPAEKPKEPAGAPKADEDD
jgi:hypothetical protein